MSAPRDLLLAALGEHAALLGQTEAAWARGRLAWPTVVVAADALAARIIARATAPDADPADGSHDADLYMATALTAGEPAAIALFEAQLMPSLDAVLARFRLAPDQLDEVKQTLRVNLLVGDGDRAGRIDSYLGVGPLASWLRVTATRLALSLRRRTHREESLSELVLAGWPDGGPDPARRLLHQTYAVQLKTALADALTSLTARERNLLRHSVIDELTVDELALMFRVHRSTCARWLVDARAALGRATRRALADQLGPRDGQLDSVLRLVESDVELSLSRLMRGGAAADATAVQRR